MAAYTVIVSSEVDPESNTGYVAFGAVNGFGLSSGSPLVVAPGDVITFQQEVGSTGLASISGLAIFTDNNNFSLSSTNTSVARTVATGSDIADTITANVFISGASDNFYFSRETTSTTIAPFDAQPDEAEYYISTGSTSDVTVGFSVLQESDAGNVEAYSICPTDHGAGPGINGDVTGDRIGGNVAAYSNSSGSATFTIPNASCPADTAGDFIDYYIYAYRYTAYDGEEQYYRAGTFRIKRVIPPDRFITFPTTVDIVFGATSASVPLTGAASSTTYRIYDGATEVQQISGGSTAAFSLGTSDLPAAGASKTYTIKCVQLEANNGSGIEILANGSINPPEVTISRDGPNTTPADFDLGSDTDVAVGSAQSSNVITISGLETTVSASFSGSGGYKYRTSSTATWSALRTASITGVNNGYQFQVFQTASANYGTTQNSFLTVGGRSNEKYFTTTATLCPTTNTTSSVAFTAGSQETIAVQSAVTSGDELTISVSCPYEYIGGFVPPFTGAQQSLIYVQNVSTGSAIVLSQPDVNGNAVVKYTPPATSTQVSATFNIVHIEELGVNHPQDGPLWQPAPYGDDVANFAVEVCVGALTAPSTPTLTEPVVQTAATNVNAFISDPGGGGDLEVFLSTSSTTPTITQAATGSAGDSVYSSGWVTPSAAGGGFSKLFSGLRRVDTYYVWAQTKNGSNRAISARASINTQYLAPSTSGGANANTYIINEGTANHIIQLLGLLSNHEYQLQKGSTVYLAWDTGTNLLGIQDIPSGVGSYTLYSRRLVSAGGDGTTTAVADTYSVVTAFVISSFTATQTVAAGGTINFAWTTDGTNAPLAQPDNLGVGYTYSITDGTTEVASGTYPGLTDSVASSSSSTSITAPSSGTLQYQIQVTVDYTDSAGGARSYTTEYTNASTTTTVVSAPTNLTLGTDPGTESSSANFAVTASGTQGTTELSAASNFSTIVANGGSFTFTRGTPKTIYARNKVGTVYSATYSKALTAPYLDTNNATVTISSYTEGISPSATSLTRDFSGGQAGHTYSLLLYGTTTVVDTVASNSGTFTIGNTNLPAEAGTQWYSVRAVRTTTAGGSGSDYELTGNHIYTYRKFANPAAPVASDDNAPDEIVNIKVTVDDKSADSITPDRLYIRRNVDLQDPVVYENNNPTYITFNGDGTYDTSFTQTRGVTSPTYNYNNYLSAAPIDNPTEAVTPGKNVRTFSYSVTSSTSYVPGFIDPSNPTVQNPSVVPAGSTDNITVTLSGVTDESPQSGDSPVEVFSIVPDSVTIPYNATTLEVGNDADVTNNRINNQLEATVEYAESNGTTSVNFEILNSDLPADGAEPITYRVYRYRRSTAGGKNNYYRGNTFTVTRESPNQVTNFAPALSAYTEGVDPQTVNFSFNISGALQNTYYWKINRLRGTNEGEFSSETAGSVTLPTTSFSVDITNNTTDETGVIVVDQVAYQGETFNAELFTDSSRTQSLAVSSEFTIYDNDLAFAITAVDSPIAYTETEASVTVQNNGQGGLQPDSVVYNITKDEIAYAIADLPASGSSETYQLGASSPDGSSIPNQDPNGGSTSNTYELRVWNGNELLSGPQFSIVRSAANTDPTSFDLGGPISNVSVATQFFSDIITVSGLDVPSTISVSGTGSPAYSINGGSFVNTSGTVSNGQTVQLRVTSSSFNSTEVVGTLTIGSVSDTFSVTTVSSGGSGTPIPSGDSNYGVEVFDENGTSVILSPATRYGSILADSGLVTLDAAGGANDNVLVSVPNLTTLYNTSNSGLILLSESVSVVFTKTREAQGFRISNNSTKSSITLRAFAIGF